ncbi:MAG: DUF2617 family protein [Planctomycetaceae bacterium]
MNLGFVRPGVSELSLHLFSWSIHPELFETRRQESIQQKDYSATVGISDTGHVVEFRAAGVTLTEVLACSEQLLPDRKRVLKRRLKGCRDESYTLESGIQYHLSFQVEKLPPDVFLNLHEELLLDCQRAPLGHSFGMSNRMAPAALSFVQTDIWPGSLLFHVFHTFPEDCAIVKTQTLFEL